MIASQPLGLGKARGLVALGIACAHLGLFALMMPASRASSVGEPVTVTLEREAGPSQDLAATEVAKAVEGYRDDTPSAAAPSPSDLPLIDAPEMAPFETPAVVVSKTAAKTEKAAMRKVPPKQTTHPKVVVPRTAKREAMPRPTPPALASHEGRAQTDAPRAQRNGGGGSDAGYASRVRAILQARANALGFEDVNASVALSFTVDASGRVISASVTRPSGDFKVDGALRKMLQGASFPPPPGGRFSGTAPIRIH